MPFLPGNQGSLRGLSQGLRLVLIATLVTLGAALTRTCTDTLTALVHGKPHILMSPKPSK